MISDNGQQTTNATSETAGDELSLVEKVARFAEKSFKGIFDAALTRFPDSMSIGFTGCGNKAGTTVTTLHAGIYSAIGCDLNTLLVDANFRQPQLSKTFGAESAAGLAECLIDNSQLGSAIRKTEVSKLSVLPSGNQSLKSKKNLTSLFENLLQELGADYQVILVDLSNADGQVVQLFGSACDQVILVADPNKNPPKRIRVAKNRLSKRNVSIKGLFLNQIQG